MIGQGLYQHDLDARPIFPRFQIPLTDKSLLQPHEIHVNQAFAAANRFLSSGIALDKGTPAKFSIFQPKAYKGIIASGDIFVSDPLSHETLKLTDQHVLAVEMEGGAVAQVCDEYKVPYIVIRTISDKADHSAHIDFQAFISEIGSHFSAGITREFIKAI